MAARELMVGQTTAWRRTARGGTAQTRRTIIGGVLAAGVLLAACMPSTALFDEQFPVFPELGVLRKNEVVRLNTYQWEDQQKGVVRLPVRRAMELTLKEWGSRPREPVPVDRKVAIPVAAAGASAQDAATMLANAGKQVFAAKACVACHSTADMTVKTCPPLKSLFGRVEEMMDGSKVTVDEDYVVESIRKPLAKIVKGFPPAMPVIVVDDAEVGALVAYLKTL